MTAALSLFIFAFATLSVIIDPSGNLPVFMSLAAHLDGKQHRCTAWEANVSAFIILSISGSFGFRPFGILGVALMILQISRGLLLFLMASQLLTGEGSKPNNEKGEFNIAAVPLGAPLLAGSDAIATLMVQMDSAHHGPPLVTKVAGAVSLILVCSWVATFPATPVLRVSDGSGMAVLTHFSGISLVVITIRLMITGVTTILDSMVAARS